MHKLGVQEVIDTLDEIAANFENEIVPICGQLVDELMKSVQSLLCQQQDELNDDTLLSIDNRLQVVSTLVGYLETHKELYNSLLSILYPYLQVWCELVASSLRCSWTPSTLIFLITSSPFLLASCSILITIVMVSWFLLFSFLELYQLYPSLVNYLSLGAIDYCTDAFSLFSLFIGNEYEFLYSIHFLVLQSSLPSPSITSPTSILRFSSSRTVWMNLVLLSKLISTWLSYWSFRIVLVCVSSVLRRT